MGAEMSVSELVDQILAQAAAVGGETWVKIRKSAPLYVKGYVQSLVDISDGVANDEMTKKDGKMYAQNARLLLDMGIANTSHIILIQVQKFMDGVIAALKATINGALRVPIL